MGGRNSQSLSFLAFCFITPLFAVLLRIERSLSVILERVTWFGVKTLLTSLFFRRDYDPLGLKVSEPPKSNILIIRGPYFFSLTEDTLKGGQY